MSLNRRFLTQYTGTGEAIFDAQESSNLGVMTGRALLAAPSGGYLINDRGSGADLLSVALLDSPVGPNIYYAPGARIGFGDLVGLAIMEGIGTVSMMVEHTGSGALAPRSSMSGTGFYTVDTPTGSGDMIGGAVLAATAATIHAGRYVIMAVRDSQGNIMPNLTNLRWAWFDQAFPENFSAPVDSGSDGFTNGAGIMILDFPHSQLTPGQTGWITITNSNGSANQSPPALSISKPFVVL